MIYEKYESFLGEGERLGNDHTLKPAGVHALAHIRKNNLLNNTRGIESIVISE